MITLFWLKSLILTINKVVSEVMSRDKSPTISAHDFQSTELKWQPDAFIFKKYSCFNSRQTKSQVKTCSSRKALKRSLSSHKANHPIMYSHYNLFRYTIVSSFPCTANPTKKKVKQIQKSQCPKPAICCFWVLICCFLSPRWCRTLKSASLRGKGV